MLGKLIPVKKDLLFERTYAAPRSRVWEAWTRPELLKQWWGPEKTFIPECEVDLRIEEAGTTIHHDNELTLADGPDGSTVMTLRVTITDIGPDARLAAFGMKWGYKQPFGKLAALLSAQVTTNGES